jgi:hypothetical protein
MMMKIMKRIKILIIKNKMMIKFHLNKGVTDIIILHYNYIGQKTIMTLKSVVDEDYEAWVQYRQLKDR